uniref:FERM domain-containing protein 8 n=1 Tax=Syphacia muris TaxID=451379 RepID=A0A0N5A9W9_9BILA
MVTKRPVRVKLSQTRHTNLKPIELGAPPKSVSGVKSCLTPDGASSSRVKPKQVTYADQNCPSPATSIITPLPLSAVGTPTNIFRFRHALSGGADLGQRSSQLSALNKKEYEQMNITVYRADMKGYKFCYPTYRKKTAKEMLIQLASHFGVDEKTFRSCCAIWIVSDFLELQLRDNHDPWELRKKWPVLLKEYGCASEEQMAKDEPLLFVRRNVHLGLEKEKSVLEEDCEAIAEILYLSAREEVIAGRYACDLDTSIRLAGLQMTIELGTYDANEHSLKNICYEIPDYFPVQHRNNVKSFYLFGIPVVGRKTTEYKIIEAFKAASTDANCSSNHQRRKAYLEIVQKTPLYGAAFFHGLVERRPAESLMDIKTMVLNVALPSVEVVVGINRNYCGVMITDQCELLFITPLSVCEVGIFDRDEQSNSKESEYSTDSLPVLYLSVENSLKIVGATKNCGIQSQQHYTFVPIYTKQAKLANFLHSTLSKLENKKPIKNISVCEAKQFESSIVKSLSSTSSTEDQKLEPTLAAASNNQIISNENANILASWSMKAENNVDVESKSASTSPLECLTPNINKVCIAEFDDSLRCLNAQGSLKKILQEVM